jgi:hypothetical protein
VLRLPEDLGQPHLWDRRGGQQVAQHLAGADAGELPALTAQVRQLVAGHGPTPHLDRLLATVPSS